MLPAEISVTPTIAPSPGTDLDVHLRPLYCAAYGVKDTVLELALSLPPNTQTSLLLITRVAVMMTRWPDARLVPGRVPTVPFRTLSRRKPSEPVLLARFWLNAQTLDADDAPTTGKDSPASLFHAFATLAGSVTRFQDLPVHVSMMPTGLVPRAVAAAPTE